MSNPGVIKLAYKKTKNHIVWLDDNIGESIHFHLDNLRIDFTIDEFIEFADRVEKIQSLLSREKGNTCKGDEISFQIDSGAHCIIFGAGKKGREIYTQLSELDSVAEVIVVDNKCRQSLIEGVEVYLPDILTTREFDNVIIAVASVEFKQEIYQQLKDMEIDDEKIIFV